MGKPFDFFFLFSTRYVFIGVSPLPSYESIGSVAFQSAVGLKIRINHSQHLYSEVVKKEREKE